MATRRGDNIPSIKEYAHWNEEAEAVWYAENKYDMEHPDEILSDGWEEDYDPWDEDPLEEREFDTKEDAEEFFLSVGEGTMKFAEYSKKWIVEVWKR